MVLLRPHNSSCNNHRMVKGPVVKDEIGASLAHLVRLLLGLFRGGVVVRGERS